MAACEVCGNAIRPGCRVCPFCGSGQESSQNGSVASGSKEFLHRTVNIEQGKPLVESALLHLQTVIREARESRIKALTVIHGYGSSGKGGAIRKECRKTLDFLCSRGKLNCYVPGEEFNRRNSRVKNLVNRYPQLSKNRNLNRNNPGITLIIL